MPHIKCAYPKQIYLSLIVNTLPPSLNICRLRQATLVINVIYLRSTSFVSVFDAIQHKYVKTLSCELGY
jgi:hypothetical protein